MTTTLARIAAVTIVAGLAGCALAPAPGCASGEQGMVSEMLYFGTQTPAGAVTPEQWTQFLAADVTPRFPRGLTVWPADGQWQSANGGITRESSYVLNLLHADDTAGEAAVRAVVEAYRTRFKQESVMRVRSRACTSF